LGEREAEPEMENPPDVGGFRSQSVPASPKAKRDFWFPGARVTLSHHRSRRTTMKTFLAFAAAFGLSASAAYADCASHSNVSASVDTQTKTASVTNTDMSTATNTPTVKKHAPEKAE
jgi:hypothetical protein